MNDNEKLQELEVEIIKLRDRVTELECITRDLVHEANCRVAPQRIADPPGES